MQGDASGGCRLPLAVPKETVEALDRIDSPLLSEYLTCVPKLKLPCHYMLCTYSFPTAVTDL